MSVRILVGDVRQRLTSLADGSVRCCVTSPPYFGLRDYGVSGQIGMESTPDAYVDELVAVFREVRRVLADDGTLWLNLGDSYAANEGQRKVTDKAGDKSASNAGSVGAPSRCVEGLPAKNLIGIPWRVAFALQADGWYLRSDIIWHKPNPMPESVTDRPTKSHEYLFLLAKSERYYYDAAAIAEEATCTNPHDSIDARKLRASMEQKSAPTSMKAGIRPSKQDALGKATYTGFNDHRSLNPTTTRNKRTVWTVPTMPFKGAHFATFPTALIEPCILAGSQAAGRRCDCDVLIETPTGTRAGTDPSRITGRAGMNRPRGNNEGTAPITRREQRHHAVELRTSAHRAAMEAEAGGAFAHYIRTDEAGARPLPAEIRAIWRERGWITEPTRCDCPTHPADTILDPFGGAGTTGLVADRLGRNAVLCELNPEYAAMASARIIHDNPMFTQVTLEQP